MLVENLPGFKNLTPEQVSMYLLQHGWMLNKDESRLPAFQIYEHPEGEKVKVPETVVADYSRRMAEAITTIAQMHQTQELALIKELTIVGLYVKPKFIKRTRSGFPTILVPAGRIPKGVPFRKCHGQCQFFRIPEEYMRYAFEDGSRPKDGHIAIIDLKSGTLGCIRLDKHVELVLNGSWKTDATLMHTIFGEELFCFECQRRDSNSEFYITVYVDGGVELLCTHCLKYEQINDSPQ